MDRTELTVGIAAALMLAVLTGWTLAWIAGRLNVRNGGAAEAARARAESRLAEVEGDLRQRLAETEAELAVALARLDREQAAADEVRAAWRAASPSQGD
jgi:hypothetical protein